jgi:hypothetical protein
MKKNRAAAAAAAVKCQGDELSSSLSVKRFNKIQRINEIIQNTLFFVELCRKHAIINVKEEIYAAHCLVGMQKTLFQLQQQQQQQQQTSSSGEDEKVIEKVVRELADIMAKFGTQHMADFAFIVFDEARNDQQNYSACDDTLFHEIDKDKRALLWRFFHPIGFSEDDAAAATMHLDCSPLYHAATQTNFHLDIYGAQMTYFVGGRSYCIHGWIDDVWIDSLYHENLFVRARKKAMAETSASLALDCFTLRDLVLADAAYIKNTILSWAAHIDMVRSKKIHDVIPLIQKMKMSTQRDFIVALFSTAATTESTETPLWKYTTYLLCDAILLYDLEPEQNAIYSSLPLKIKDQIKESISNSIHYIDVLYKKYEPSLEQQIILFQAPEDIKERAMGKLKEWKNRGDENYKCKQYLEGLLRIPFGRFREEPVLKRFRALRDCIDTDFVRKEGTTGDDKTFAPRIAQKVLDRIHQLTLRELKQLGALRSSSSAHKHLGSSNGKKKCVEEWIKYIQNRTDDKTLYTIYDALFRENLQERLSKLQRLRGECGECSGALDQMRATLDAAIYGHAGAKNQIIKVLGQWMTGESTGYCFGFEGAPGIGKTSLAKGLAECLRDADGTPRPFHFIALGGSSNGTTLEGHGYTYQNSTWGRIVDILMESRCMNPIIYIDELDKVSKTEQGREIIGILTHIIDSTQNRSFQDKFFMGIPLDLSKVLFVFSYNNVEDIDRILLDRIHRVRFENISMKDKVVIVREFLEPEMDRRMGWTAPRLSLCDGVIENIIERYTAESGVRKLKECLFDIWGEANLEMIRGCRGAAAAATDSMESKAMIEITMDKIESTYLAKYPELPIRVADLTGTPVAGYVYGLYANAIGQGGILPIQCSNFPTPTFMEMKCTGLIGNVMQESMAVAKTLAWNLLDTETQRLISETTTKNMQGIHIHCPEGSTPKDGPSGGCCIALALYSLWSKRPVRANVAITGEVDLHGNVTAIGKLDAKIAGGLRAGITHFIFPEDNERDFQEYLEKNGSANVRFTRLTHIGEILRLGNEIFSPNNT